MEGVEEPLVGGNVSSVVRVGDTVHRSVGRWTEAVHGLLRHLEDVGFEGAPRVLGLDPEGREVLTYLEGVVPNESPWPAFVWSEQTLTDVGHWLRRYHEAVQTYRPPEVSRWWYRDGAPRRGELICHNDFAPYNTTFVGERIAGIIDWDIAGPARPLWDLAFCAWSWVPLHHPGLTRSLGGPGEDAQATRLRALCAAYGAGDPSALLPTVIERVAASRDGIEAGVRAGDEAMRALASAGHLEDMERTLEYLHERTPTLWRELGEEVWERQAARVAILDERERILLVSARDPDDDVVVWFMPGGSLEPGETLEEAARRELAEEVDGTATFELVGPIWTRRHLHTFAGHRIDLRESYFVARVDGGSIVGVRETGAGAEYFEGWRWWSVDELRSFEGIVAPSRLAALLPNVIAGSLPGEPIDTGI